MITRPYASLALLAAALAAPLAAQEPDRSPNDGEMTASVHSLESRASDAVAVLAGEQAAEDVFAPVFLSTVSPDQLAALKSQLEAQFGPMLGVESVTPTRASSADIAIRFERAIGRGAMQLAPDGDNMIVGLVLRTFEPLDDNAAKIRADLEALPGTVSVLYTPLDSWADPILAVNADRPMAVGSTFKLYVLSALARSVAAGDHGWDEVVRLNTRSLPSGQMHAWPEQTPVTLATLATMMIAYSDNTATDQLISVLGRDRVADEVLASGHATPDAMLPFLTTLELFALKGEPTLGDSYIAAGRESEAAQAAKLEEISASIAGNPDNIAKPTFAEPHAIDTIEWFASGQDIRAIMERLKTLPEPIARKIMAVNPALPEEIQSNWAYTGYKGGSEPGVLNLSWLLQGKAGEWYVLAMSWNDEESPVDQTTFELLANRILSLPR